MLQQGKKSASSSSVHNGFQLGWNTKTNLPSNILRFVFHCQVTRFSSLSSLRSRQIFPIQSTKNCLWHFKRHLMIDWYPPASQGAIRYFKLPSFMWLDISQRYLRNNTCPWTLYTSCIADPKTNRLASVSLTWALLDFAAKSTGDRLTFLHLRFVSCRCFYYATVMSCNSNTS